MGSAAASSTPISRRSWRRGPTPSCCRRPKAAPRSCTPMPSSPPKRRSPGSPRGISRSSPWRSRARRDCFWPAQFGRQSARLIGLSWGAEDLAAELGAESNRDPEGRYTSPYVYARTLCLMAAATAQVAAIETIYMDYRDPQGLRRDSEEARRDGFTGRLAIHPAQVPIINEVFTPSPAARRRGASDRRRLRGKPGRRRHRHRRRDVRPPASGARATADRAREGLFGRCMIGRS